MNTRKRRHAYKVTFHAVTPSYQTGSSLLNQYRLNERMMEFLPSHVTPKAVPCILGPVYYSWTIACRFTRRMLQDTQCVIIVYAWCLSRLPDTCMSKLTVLTQNDVVYLVRFSFILSLTFSFSLALFLSLTAMKTEESVDASCSLQSIDWRLQSIDWRLQLAEIGSQGPSIKYVTLFWTNFVTPSLSHFVTYLCHGPP